MAYTDASYDHKADIAACGYSVYKDGNLVKHTVYIVEGLNSRVDLAETFSIVEAIRYCADQQGITSVVVYTDQTSAASYNARSRKNKYKELRQVLAEAEKQSVSVEIKYVKSHGVNKRHNELDKICLSRLRRYLRTRSLD